MLPLNIMLVEDDPAHAMAIRRAFARDSRACTLFEVDTLAGYHRQLEVTMPDIALVDLNLPDGRAMEILSFPPEDGPFPLLVMTSYGSEALAVEAMKAGALDYLVKSAETFASMPAIVTRALREWQLRQERKRLQFQLQQAQKMELVGQLAGGIAHDFNNILTGISGYASLASLKMLEPAAVTVALDNILLLTERAAHLTRSLLSFGRKHELKITKIDINQLIADLLKLVHHIVRKNIVFQVDYAPVNILIDVDRVLMEQVLLNLINNAMDAMPDGGVITLSTRLKRDLRPLTGIQNSCQVEITVADTGSGIPQEHQERIFEPFFTTKEVGKGTGLGLAMVQSIISDFLGTITLNSSSANGTEFIVRLPAHPNCTFSEVP